MTRPTDSAHDDGSAPFARHRMRIITLSTRGVITSDTLQPWSSVSISNSHTGQPPDFPAAEIPSGVIRRTADGNETLLTVDGLRLELDGRGNATVHDGFSEVPGPGIFMVVEIQPGDLD